MPSHKQASSGGRRAADADCRPAPEYEKILREARLTIGDEERRTSETIFWDWLRREAAAGDPLEAVALESARDILIPGRNLRIPARVYTPLDRQLARGGDLPVIVFFHGGGWVIGSIDTHDSVARAFAAQTPAIVVSVDYRLAPEHPFPAAVHDAYAAVQWISLHAAEIGGDPARIAVAGDSAGGNLAAVVSLIARDKAARREAAPSLRMQALFYPSVNISDTSYPSYQRYGHGYGLTKKGIETSRRLYLPNEEDRVSRLASPLLAPELSDMPRTLVVASGCDPLRDEAEHLAERLAHARVVTEYWLIRELIHGFLSDFNRAPRSLSEKVEKVIVASAAVLRDAFR